MAQTQAASQYNFQALTASVLALPPKYGKISDKGLFQRNTDRITQPTAVIEQAEGELRLIKENVEGGAPEIIGRDTEKFLTVRVPLYKLAKPIQWSDVNNQRAFGQVMAFRTVQSEQEKTMRKLRDFVDVTKEAQFMSALLGTVKKSDGSTLYNLFDEFGVTQESVSLELNVDTTNVYGICADIAEYMNTELKTSYGQLNCICGPTLFHAIANHPNVKALYSGFNEERSDRPTHRRDNPLAPFYFGGIWWELYTGSFTESDGDNRLAIAVDEGIVYPTGMGADEMYRQILAPVDWMEVVNTPGLELYAAEYMKGEGPAATPMTEVAYRMLPIVTRPQGLYKVTYT